MSRRDPAAIAPAATAVAAAAKAGPATGNAGTAPAGAGPAPPKRSLSARTLGRLRRWIAPTAHERSYARWVRDRGDETLRFRYRLGPEAVVLDVGGYEGRWAEGVLERFHCTVHVFEPVPAFAAGIRARLARFDSARVHAFGLAGADREAEMALAADGTSALRGSGAACRVRLREARGALAGLGIGGVDLAKINIEGGEYELLEHLLDAGLAGRFRHLQVQFHDFVPDAAPRMRRILDRLAATHAPEWRYPFVWESWALRTRAAAPAAGARPAGGPAGAGS